jgi:hypothetical protein
MKAVDNDSSQFTTEQVTVAGIITADNVPYITHFYVETRPGGPWNGVQIYGGSPVPIAEGDSVLPGYVSEYFFKTEITGPHYPRLTAWQSLPDPRTRPAHQDRRRDSRVLRRCRPPDRSSQTPRFDQFGEWKNADTFGASTPPWSATTATNVHSDSGAWMNIRGPIDYIYDDFRIVRRDADIDLERDRRDRLRRPRRPCSRWSRTSRTRSTP